MKANMGSADRVIRLILGVIIAVLYFATDYLSGTIGIVLLVLGAIFIFTSLVSFCPLYLPLGLSTRKK
ncbi:MAG: DUF2892 domain-containing protein [Bacteroidales bacterium]|nr:DUF2892 domain-containing protein [Bacteroidales bacterium]MCF8403101.1 DUF2892 domain-containing protein [Bacteroidales bacterium]